MSQQGAASHDTSVNPIETLTGNSGGAVGPDGAGNIDVQGNNGVGVDIVGTPGSNLLTVLGIQATTAQIGVTEFATAIETGTLTDTTRAITPDALEPILATGFVVAAGGAYTTIQAACDAANAAGGGIVVVRPGAYSENLTLYDDVHILGLTLADAGGGVEITGVHTPPSTGGFVFRNVKLISATHIFNSAVAGSSHLIIIDTAIVVTNGYTFNVPNWTGILESFDVNDGGGVNDGYINNTAGATVATFDGSFGAGSANPLITSGFWFASGAGINCPLDFQAGANASIDNSYILGNCSFSNNSTGEISNSRISSGASAAVTMSSSAAWKLTNCIVDSSASPSIAGAGAGILTLTSVSFLDNALMAATLTTAGAEIKSGSLVAFSSITAGETEEDVTFTINGSVLTGTIALHSDNAADLGGFVEERHSPTAAFGAHTLMLRSRGTEGAPALVSSGDVISRMVAAGYDGTDYAQAAEIRVEVDGTPGNDDMPGRMLFLTSQDGGQTPILGMTIDSSQELILVNPLAVTSGGTGATSLTDHGILLGSGTGAITPLGSATNGQLPIGSTGADPTLATLTGSANISVTNGAGSITLDLTSETRSAAISGWNGSILETASVIVTSDGATITCSVELSGGGDLTVVFSDGFYDWDTTPADTVTLTAGSDASPTLNYVYFLQSTKTLTVSTSSFPTTEYAPIATVLCQSVASLQTEGAYKVHVWTDHLTDEVDQGHLTDVNAWIRAQDATWRDGVNQTYTITANGGSADNVILTTASGNVLQLHSHIFPAFAGTPDIYVVNDSVTPYTVVTDLNALLTDSQGVSMSGRFFSLVIWGSVSEDTGDCKLYCNLPAGSYNNQAGVLQDTSQFAEFSTPSDFTGTAFLISEWKLRHQVAASGTWTSIDEIDLRGLFPALSVGGGTSSTSEFVDNAFRVLDDGDNTKEIAFQASAITTATTRTITMIDADIDLANVVQASSALSDFFVICGDGGGRGTQSIAAIGSSGQVLTSNGAAALPTFQTPAAAQTLTVVIQDFTASGTYTPTSGMDYCIVECIGGGGGGGGVPTGSDTAAGTGGGGGEYSRGVYSAATIGASQSVTIGAAGAVTSGAAGTAGGTTSLGSTIISAVGGSGGAVGTDSTLNNTLGVAGGTGGTGGDFHSAGHSSSWSLSISSPGMSQGSNGANSQFGGGGLGGQNAVGAAATGYGAGGGGASRYGATGAKAGGLGTAGLLVVTEYVLS